MSFRNNLFILLTLSAVLSGHHLLNGQTPVSNYFADPQGFGKFGVYYINQPKIYYCEDYYDLYARRNYYNQDEICLNILFMQGALKSPWRPAYRALLPLHTEQEQKKYRDLIRMHLNLRILQDYLYLGRLYDMQDLYFYHRDFTDDLVKSLQFAEYYYGIAAGYWIEVKRHAVDAFLMKDVRIGLDTLEDEMNLIVFRDVDWQFDRIINTHLEKVRQNLERLRKGPDGG